MSRTTDIDVSLSDRTTLANESGADLFVSIHHNSSNPFKSGTMVYYPITEEHGERSDASKVLAENINLLTSSNTRLKNLGIYEEDFQVLRETNMPAILTETGYMGGDIRLLMDPNNRQAIAESIAEGILMELRRQEAQERIAGIWQYFINMMCKLSQGRLA